MEYKFIIRAHVKDIGCVFIFHTTTTTAVARANRDDWCWPPVVRATVYRSYIVWLLDDSGCSIGHLLLFRASQPASF